MNITQLQHCKRVIAKAVVSAEVVTMAVWRWSSSAEIPAGQDAVQDVHQRWNRTVWQKNYQTLEDVNPEI